MKARSASSAALVIQSSAMFNVLSKVTILKGGKGTVLAASTGNGDNLRPVDRVNPDLADCPFLAIVRNHDL